MAASILGFPFINRTTQRPVESQIPTNPSVARLIRRLDEATASTDIQQVCQQVKDTLIDEVAQGHLQLPEELVAPRAEGYARRLLHHDPEDRYTIVIMTWGSGQGTPIHDHDGKWCVECVCLGSIRVTSYELIGDVDADQVRFRRERDISAGFGEAGSLIPPFDYHVIENPHQNTAATIHVYGGAMDGCYIFSPLQEGSPFHQKEWRELSYSG